ncbi:MAG: PilN domain-containing protein [Geminicoccales bacterium]
MSSVIGLARSGLSAFLSWWQGELAGLLPRRLERARRDRRQVVLLINRHDTVVLERTGDRARVFGTVAADRPGHAGELKALLQRTRSRRQPVTIALSGELGLRKIVSLPLAAKDDLAQLLRFEMDRLTPFRADEVYFAQRIVETDLQDRRIVVELAVAPKATVDQALESARSAGVVPARLELVDAGIGGASPLNLLPHEPADRAGERRLSRVLLLLALLLAIIAVAVPLQRQRSRLAELTDQIAATRAQAEQSHDLRERLDQLTRTSSFLLAEKGRRASATDILAELTRLVPDQAHLHQLTLAEGEVQLHGSAATASDLIGLLDGSPLFRAPQFRSPVTQGGEDGAERFHLSAELATENR